MTDDGLYFICRAIPHAQPNDLWRRTVKEAELVKVTILGDNSEAMVLGVFPNIGIIGLLRGRENIFEPVT